MSMTIGQKLAGYRKLSGMTQQQLGDRLNISAQAISKWEKDLSEPALATLRTLAELYKVSVDELLDPESGFPDMSALGEPEEESEKLALGMPIGFCKECGIAVTEENLGSTQPTVLCLTCKETVEAAERLEAARRLEEEKKEERAKRRAGELAEAEKEQNRAKRRRKRTVSLTLAGVAAASFLALMIAVMVSGGGAGLIPFTLIGAYVVFAFVSSLFYDCFVQTAVFDLTTRSFQWPGLIFTFDLDGILWLIGMKLLFFVLGLALSLLWLLFGLSLGLLTAPFVFPLVMAREGRAIAKGEAPEI